MSSTSSFRSDWKRFLEGRCVVPSLGISLDVSRMNCPQGFFAAKATAMRRAFAAMRRLERGAIANPDEQRRVGHYWLRAPELAPERSLAADI
ncbi:MAG: glucose-6-phosphate isomerase, partial [Verrucomicrobiae bacterium]|nr:glucose-6-phosphate isomerase [Verrucomicrobiae bacterium]